MRWVRVRRCCPWRLLEVTLRGGMVGVPESIFGVESGFNSAGASPLHPHTQGEQQRLANRPSRYNRPERLKYITTYGKPQYVKIKGDIQRIELHRGCPHGHEYCYEPQENIDFPIPKIERTHVQILDMNLLARKEILGTLKELSEVRVNGKIVYYEAVCGFDFRKLTIEIAQALKNARFKRIRLAWDGAFRDQYKIKDAINIFLKAGYHQLDISLFVIVNWRITRVECERKLDLMKVWRVKVCDCCFDAGYRYAVPEFWIKKDIVEFRARCRKHNQLVNFGIDPEEVPS